MKRIFLHLNKNILIGFLLFFAWIGLGVALADNYEQNKYINSPFGINNPYNEEGIGIDVKRYLDGLGIHWVKMSLHRAKIERSKGQYQWASTDEEVNTIFNNGKTNIIGVINPFTKWDTKGGRVSKRNTKYYVGDWEAYQQYVTALIKRYGNKIKYWMVFNEPEAEYQHRLEEYVKLLKITYTLIKSLDPQAKIILGAFTINPQYTLFREKLLTELGKYKKEEGFFDIADFHTYFFAGMGYRQFNQRGSIITYDTYIELFKKHGFGKKPIWISEGGTYTGEDPKIRMSSFHGLPYQSEKDQAIFLVKRFFYAASKGIEKIFWSSIREHENFFGTIHNQFNLVGLVYNGIPKKGACDGQLPCPDPGDGVKKLSYYTYKFLIEKFEGSDWDTLKMFTDSHKDLYLFRVIKRGTQVYIMWWDKAQNDLEKQKYVTLSVSPTGNKYKALLTEAVPNAASGANLNEKDYPNFFTITQLDIKDKMLKIVLTDRPVYIEGVNIDKIQ